MSHAPDCLCVECCPCACKAIGVGRLGFCREHRRAFIPAETDAISRALLVALANNAGFPLVSTSDGLVGQPS